MLTANKGEWAEFYAFLKVLAERDVALADENLLAKPGSSITFLKIYRSGHDGMPLIYSLGEAEIAIENDLGAQIAAVPTAKVTSELHTIFSQISKSASTTFSIMEAQALAQILMCNSIKAPSQDKADIVASIRDRSTGMDERAGFSVKSLVGGASTLLNAGKTTNFVYEVTGVSQDIFQIVNEIDGQSKIRDRVAYIQEKGGKFCFSGLKEPIFSRNLRKIDTMMPEFLAEMVFGFYCGAGSSVALLSGVLSKNADFSRRFELSADDFEYKIKQLLVSIALGLVPSKLWSGLMLAHGGYLIVKPQGDLVCYHAIHRDLFLEYLYQNTKFETASSTRHDFGTLYSEGKKIYMNLNLQIRFK
jgi:hypothetical protein